MIQVYDTLSLGYPVLCKCQSGTEQRLLYGKHFEIIGRSVVHKKPGLFRGGFKIADLPLIKTNPPVCCLPFGKGVVHLIARVEQGLFKSQCSLLLACFGYLQAGDVRTFVEQWWR